MANRSLSQRILWVLWPSFLVAAVAELLVFAVIVFVVAGVRHESAQREEFRQLCADSDGRALAYANGSDLCVASDGRIIITR
jgi:hypothetical protein